MAAPNRLLTPERREDDTDASLRPLVLADFIGQRQARANLQVYIESAKTRGDALDHVLLFGPPGLGKTTLAQIVAREMGVGFRATSGPVIAKSGDLAALLTNLEDGDVLFIELPASVVLEITYTEPGLQGDRSTGGTKPATLETGLKIQVPPFIGIGERVVVKTEDASYQSRVK